MINYDYYGLPLTHQKIVPGNTATALSAYCYKYKLYRLNFDDADTTIHVGDWVVGATSGAQAKVRYITADSWTNGSGYALIDSWNGTAWTNDEEIKAAGDATCANVDQAAAIVEASNEEYVLAGVERYRDMVARFALVVCTAQTALVNINGGIPDQTALIGIPMWANSTLPLQDASEIAAFKVIDYTAGSASTIQVEFFF